MINWEFKTTGFTAILTAACAWYGAVSFARTAIGWLQ